jgi:hypothetical protein
VRGAAGVRGGRLVRIYVWDSRVVHGGGFRAWDAMNVAGRAALSSREAA